MGGRGSNSGIDGGNLSNNFNGKWFGIKVVNNGGTKTEYFFRQTETGLLMKKGIAPAPITAPISSVQNFVDNARKSARSVEIINPKDVSQRMAEYNETQRNKPDYELGIGTPWGNKNNRKAARRQKIANRIAKRKR